ncbi:MAG: hypothetical protein AB8B91_17225 [Rubripirellula sp.]
MASIVAQQPANGKCDSHSDFAQPVTMILTVTPPPPPRWSYVGKGADLRSLPVERDAMIDASSGDDEGTAPNRFARGE